MKVKYVGAMPQVSNKGIAFDHTQPDKYTFLGAVIELLEALNYGPTETTKHLHKITPTQYSDDALMEALKKFCPDIDKVFADRQAKTDALKEKLIERVHENKLISEEGRSAWLNNIELMNDYYYQYVTNESAYNCALEALAQEIHDAKIEEVTFPMFRNYGLVLHDLMGILSHRKPPIDATLNIETSREGVIGRLSIQHPY